MANSRRNLAAAGVASIILVAMIVALTVDTEVEKKDESKHSINDTKKSVQSLCEGTDYKQACVKSLAGANTTDPNELLQVAFKATMDAIEKAIKDSSTMKSLQSDPRAKMALEDCQEQATRALNDLRRSFSKFSNYDFSRMNEMLEDLKIWLSGAATYEQTCLDGFEDVQGDAGERMKRILETAMELTSNALAMVSEVSSLVTSLGVSSKRRLLSNNGGFPEWVDSRQRRLMTDLTKPDLVIAKDGSGNYTTINEGLKDIPKHSNKTFVIHIKEGVYAEKVQFNSSWINLFVFGDGPKKTRITGGLNFIDGTTTYHTATVAVLGDFFIAKDIGFENSAGAAKHQAVALRVGADKVIFYNCHMDGYQDTLYVHTYRQYYRDCKISGTIDFVFGDSASLFQNCIFEIREPLPNQQCIVTAQGRKDPRQPTGLVLQNCQIVADPAFYPIRAKTKSYLGRPWKEFSRTIIMESFIDDLIDPAGWLAWNGTFGLETLFYTEFNNRGAGSPKEMRLNWTGVKELTSERIQRFTGNPYFLGDSWIPQTGVPYVGTFMLPLPSAAPTKPISDVTALENRDVGNAKDRTSYQARTDLISDHIIMPLNLTLAHAPPTPNATVAAAAAAAAAAAPAPSTNTTIPVAAVPAPSPNATQPAAAAVPTASPNATQPAAAAVPTASPNTTQPAVAAAVPTASPNTTAAAAVPTASPNTTQPAAAAAVVPTASPNTTNPAAPVSIPSAPPKAA